MRAVRELFPSVVLTVCNAESFFAPYLDALSTLLSENFDYYEILIVDDASSDGTSALIEEAQKRLPNITLFCLPKTYDQSIAIVAGLDHAIGDFVITLDPQLDQPTVVLDLMAQAAQGADIVYALPRDRLESVGMYNRLVKTFLGALAKINHIDMPAAVSSARLFSRAVLNYILKASDRHRILSVAPALSGFKYASLIYDRHNPGGETGHRQARRQALSKAFNLLFAVSPRPLRMVTLMTLGVSVVTIFYSIYVVIYWLLSDNVAPGWASISLQISGLFFLISLVLAVMSEYLQQILEGIERRPLYYVARRTQSDTIAYAQDLNVIEGDTPALDDNRQEADLRPQIATSAGAPNKEPS